MIQVGSLQITLNKKKKIIKHSSLEMSKLILFIEFIMVSFLTSFICLMTYRTDGTTELTAILQVDLALIGLLSVSCGFYYWKARYEFKIKYDKDFKTSEINPQEE